MIRFALACDQGHEFESWFPSGSSYEAQAERGLVSCPVCGTAKVDKRLMAPAIPKKGARTSAPEEVRAEITPSLPALVPAPPSPQAMALMSEREQAVRSLLRELRDHVTKNADYVGDRFADEARKIHYGETEHRSIYGEANPAETKALIEEGIEVHPLPVLPEERN